MSFRTRLSLFFAVIVIVPMVAVSLVLFRLIGDNQEAKADATVSAAAHVATALWGNYANQATERADIVGIGHDPQLLRSLTTGDNFASKVRAQQLLVRYRLTRMTISWNGRPIADVGSPQAIAPVVRELVSTKGKQLAMVALSAQSASQYIGEAQDLTGDAVIVSQGGTVLASTLADQGSRVLLPSLGTTTVGGRSYRIASFTAPGFNGAQARVAVLVKPPVDNTPRERVLTGGLFVAFFLAALAFAVLVSRALQRQIAGFLRVARRLGSGDLDARIRSSGRDEFAALGDEFNQMADTLQKRMKDLSDEHERLNRSLRRVGETFASNLDREALLGIALRTAVDGVDAQSGRAIAGTEDSAQLRECARVGEVGEMHEALEAVESAALETASATAQTIGDISALAYPLRGLDGRDQVLGVVSVARAGRDFASDERALFAYLARQAGVSIENVTLHEQARMQAVTDDLTGLYNHRRFNEALRDATSRGRRYEHAVALVLLDLDDFKVVNDRYGHPQGDLVLREVAQIMRSHSRAVDTPARYGGEELAIVLPHTDLDGAHELAERLRRAIEGLELPVLDGSGTMGVTASIGVAAAPSNARDIDDLLAAADTALYQAKRTGKNKTVLAR